MQQRHFIEDVILRFYPDNITKEFKANDLLEVLQGYKKEQLLYIDRVGSDTLEIGIYDESEV